jgi:hypothetical protein
MNRIAWALVDYFAHLLEPAERDAVRGDFAESGEPPLAALSGVFGLVLRRQVAVFSPLWKDWRAWAALILIVAPLSLLLSVAALEAASGSAVYFWMYLNNWDWALLKDQGFWYTLLDSALFLSKGFLLLGCWSWSAGFLLGTGARRFIRMNARLFVVLLVFGIVFAAPAYFTYLAWHVFRPTPSDQNEPVAALAFYRSFFPVLLACALVALPALFALRPGAALHDRTVALRLVLTTAAALSLLAMSLHLPGVLFYLHAAWWPSIHNLWPVRILPFAAYWPIAYWLAALLARHRFVRTSA